MGPQLSYCRPSAQGNSKWFNIRIANPCFFSSRVMFSKKHNMFRIPGAGGQLIASWDLCEDKHTPKFQELRYHFLPEPTEAEREVMDTCLTSEHMVESQSTGETFLVKCFRQTMDGIAVLQTKGVMAFRVTPKGNSVYTQDIVDLTIFISKAEAFCVRASSFPGVSPNHVYILDVMEISFFKLPDSSITTLTERIMSPYRRQTLDINSIPNLIFYILRWNKVRGHHSFRIMVFRVTPKGNAVYTKDIGDLTIFISKAEALCVRASSFPGVSPNHVYILDVMEISFFKLADSSITTLTERIMAPNFFPPQNIEY
ncbi:hypothetical protein HID58_057518 [Brassica napus]|uniref:KIB1-4 beta-propeller domain-containing protein n=1 Tax=Brassica napus TaxID=3708 RepID=A0ABQ8ARB5_BRANA|nr:hypothetical protein HID58_057518 [Brassica napus]